MKTVSPTHSAKTSDSPKPDCRIVRCAAPSFLALSALLFVVASSAQVITINTNGGAATTGPAGAGTVDRRFQQIKPTQVDLPKTDLDPKTRYELLRFLEADQGFAMRPLPRGHKGLTLAANGTLEPAGEGYLEMVTEQGLSSKPGDRIVITDVKFEKTRITFMLNGGPDAAHRFLRHIQIGMSSTPVASDDGNSATGSRITLTFQRRVPELTGKQVEALLSPLISFEVKTPIQAFTDTLPPKLKEAIFDHHVLVGMSTDMVVFAVGKPVNKIREMDGQMPFEEWIYGKPPEDVQFVRINGNRVIRVEVAKVGKAPVIFTKDEVEGLMRTDGTPLVAEDASPGTRTVEMGDVQRDPDTQAPAAPPSLRQPGDPKPTAQTAGSAGSDRVGVMKPVQFPKQAPDDHPVAHQGQQPADGSSGTGAQGTPAAGSTAPATSTAPASGSGTATPPTPTPQTPEQTPPAGTQPE
ncbi:MAG TPA: hypothetical protein VK716_13250 [Terracidiphilus sp.]|jgi:hypothetical protein|nr:hypothetical protein [Terracidiphilus sp.]